MHKNFHSLLVLELLYLKSIHKENNKFFLYIYIVIHNIKIAYLIQ